MPRRRTRRPSCPEGPVVPTGVLTVGAVGPIGAPPPLGAADAEPAKRTVAATGTTTTRRMARRRLDLGKETLSLSGAYGVSCRARAERAALRHRSGDSPLEPDRLLWGPPLPRHVVSGLGWVFQSAGRIYEPEVERVAGAIVAMGARHPAPRAACAPGHPIRARSRGSIARLRRRAQPEPAAQDIGRASRSDPARRHTERRDASRTDALVAQIRFL